MSPARKACGPCTSKLKTDDFDANKSLNKLIIDYVHNSSPVVDHENNVICTQTRPTVQATTTMKQADHWPPLTSPSNCCCTPIIHHRKQSRMYVNHSPCSPPPQSSSSSHHSSFPPPIAKDVRKTSPLTLFVVILLNVLMFILAVYSLNSVLARARADARIIIKNNHNPMSTRTMSSYRYQQLVNSSHQQHQHQPLAQPTGLIFKNQQSQPIPLALLASMIQSGKNLGKFIELPI